MNHVSLFSGIGGFDLAAEWAGFPAGWTELGREEYPDARRTRRDADTD